jgi:gliding-associated putative ABC transporter substrate-binding component GldG
MSRLFKEIITLLLIAGIVVFGILNSLRFFSRIDMTSTKVFTISQVSKSLFQDIPEKVQITYYISDRLKRVSPLPGEVEDMLHEYASFSRGKIGIEVVDPDVQGTTAQLESMGIYPQQIEVIERNEQTFARVYSAVVIEHLNTVEVLPFVLRTETLEYDLTSKIKGMVRGKEKKIGVVIGDTSRTLAGEYSYLFDQLRRKFTVESLTPGEDIPPGVEALIVLGNRDLEEFDLYPIDQWLMKGGRALFCVDGVYIDMVNNLQGSVLTGSPLLEMLEEYGVEVANTLVLDEVARDFRLPQQLFGRTVWQMIGTYPHWVAVLPQNVSKDHIVTSRFAGVDLLWPSPLEIIENEAVEASVLMSTSERAWLMEEPFQTAWLMEEPFQTNPYDARMMAASRDETEKSYPLAYALEGLFSSYFADKPVPVREGETRNWDTTVERSENTHIIVIGDADFASNIIQYSDSGYNMVFLDTITDWLSNEDEMLQIKTRQLRDMRLNQIQDPVRRERTYMFAQSLNLIIIPALVILFGVQRFLSRRKRRTVETGE